MLALFATAGAYVAYLWSTVGASVWLILGTLFVVSWNYNLAAMFVNTTVVTADAEGVNVRHGPLPSPFARNAAVQKAAIEQLYSAKHGALFAVLAKLKSGHTVRLVAPLITAEQALFFEQQLERTLGLVDFAVDGELNSDETVTLQGKRPAGASSGAALVFLIPAFIASIVGLFLLVSSTEVSGRLQASSALGSWVFEPDDCSSGQREGFGGVVLTASAHPERVIRVVRDRVQRALRVGGVRRLPLRSRPPPPKDAGGATSGSASSSSGPMRPRHEKQLGRLRRPSCSRSVRRRLRTSSLGRTDACPPRSEPHV